MFLQWLKESLGTDAASCMLYHVGKRAGVELAYEYKNVFAALNAAIRLLKQLGLARSGEVSETSDSGIEVSLTGVSSSLEAYFAKGLLEGVMTALTGVPCKSRVWASGNQVHAVVEVAGYGDEVQQDLLVAAYVYG